MGMGVSNPGANAVTLKTADYIVCRVGSQGLQNNYVY